MNFEVIPLISQFGVLGALVILLYRWGFTESGYITRAVQRHIGMMEAHESAIAEIRDSMKMIADNDQDKLEGHSTTHHALELIFDGLEILARGHNLDISEVRRRAVEVLRK